ncbi:MAG: LysR family transcriptional regulator [Stappiaceae bacterium]
MNKTERTFTDSNLLRAFVEIADCGNLTLAASRLNRSQSAISVQIRKLEMELNASLFVREGKGMSLSANGERLLPAAQRVLDELAKLQPLFETPLNGRIRVGIPDDFDEGVLERTLADFTQTNPGVEVLATSGCTATFPEAIRKGNLDIAVCSGPDDVPGDNFMDQQPVWVARETMNHPTSDPVPLAVVNHGCWLGELPKTSLEQMGRPYNIAFECTGVMSLKSAIRAGFAIGILYESTVEPGMKILTEREGFPALPTFKRSIIVRADAPQDLTIAMAKAIKRAV